MAYDEELAERVRSAVAGEAGLSERRMFGGLAFMLHGNMVCGVVKDELMLRIGPEGTEAALEREHVRPMDFTGRPMKGMVYVAQAGLEGEELGEWVAEAVDFVRTLPPK